MNTYPNESKIVARVNQRWIFIITLKPSTPLKIVNPAENKNPIISAVENNNIIRTIKKTTQDIRENISDAKSFVQQEPLGPNEVNPF